MLRTLVATVLLVLPSRALAAEAISHRVALQGNGKLAIVGVDGRIEWQMPWEGIHDIHVLASGHLMVQQGLTAVVEIDPATKKIVWSYDATKPPESQRQRVEIHSFQPLEDGRVMIAESGPARIIEVDRAGKLLKEVRLKVEHPDAHRDTRLVRKLSTGHYLACHEGDGVVREYDGKTGAVVWNYAVPLFGHERRDGHGPEAFGNQAFSAVRLANGNTLISTGNGHGVIEVTPERKIVWQLDQHDLAGITLAWVTTLDVLANGHYVIGNCHAGPDNPQIIEIDPKTKQVVWTFKQFEAFGNDVSTTQILDAGDKTLR